MSGLPLSARVHAAEKMRACRADVAETVTTAFLDRHPDWLERYGERARRLGIEDACYHLDFLAGAVESGSSAPFEDYARWTARVLAARGIGPEFLVENLEQLGLALETRLDTLELEVVKRLVAAGTKAVQATGAEAQPSGAEPLAQTRGLFLQSLLRGDRKAATGVVLEELRQGTPIESVYVDVFQEALYEIGRRWERNEITVAQEHMATAITQYVVAQMFTRLPVSTLRRGGVVITGVQGELHQVGSNMVADMLEADGWNVHFLGTNIPREGIVQAVEAHEPAILGISCTMLFNLPQVVALLDAVRRRISPFPRVLLGGGAFRSAPDLCQELGAEGYATDLRAAVALARQGDGHA